MPSNFKQKLKVSKKFALDKGANCRSASVTIRAMAWPQTEAVELDADLARRARREAERRSTALRQLVEDALRHFLAREERESQSQAAQPGLGIGRATDGLSAAKTATEPPDAEVKRRRAAAERMRGMFAAESGGSTADALIADRRAEVRAEDHEEDARRQRRSGC